MEDLIKGDINIEDATTEFEGSEEVDTLIKKYQKEYGEGYKDLQTDVGFWKGSYAGVKQVGWSLASLGLKAVENPSNVALTTAVIIAGTKGLGALSKTASYSLSGGFGVYGAYKFLDPSSTYLERGAGLVTLAVASGTLGYGAYKYLGKPVVKTVNIKSPIRSYKSSGSIGKDYKIITDKNIVNKIVFESKKLSQYGSAGRRTIVTTKGRLLSNKFWEQLGVPKKFVTMDSNAIYRGVPKLTSGTKGYFSSMKGLFKVGRQTDYQKAYKLLTKYGYSPSQATQTLRYTAPKVIEQWRSGFLNIKGIKATGQFNVLTKQPVITVDKNLGIKTRGAKTIRDVYDIERKLVMIKDPVTLKSSVYAFQEQTRIGLSILKSGKIVKFKDYDYGVSVIKSKASATQKGYEYLGKDKFGNMFWDDSAKFKDIKSVTQSQKSSLLIRQAHLQRQIRDYTKRLLI